MLAKPRGKLSCHKITKSNSTSYYGLGTVQLFSMSSKDYFHRFSSENAPVVNAITNEYDILKRSKLFRPFLVLNFNEFISVLVILLVLLLSLL